MISPQHGKRVWLYLYRVLEDFINVSFSFRSVKNFLMRAPGLTLPIWKLSGATLLLGGLIISPFAAFHVSCGLPLYGKELPGGHCILRHIVPQYRANERRSHSEPDRSFPYVFKLLSWPRDTNREYPITKKTPFPRITPFLHTFRHVCWHAKIEYRGQWMVFMVL